MPLQLRRGTEAERQNLSTPLANGEPLWITETNQLYVGNGVTPTNMLASVNSFLGVNALIGDLKGSVFEDDSSILVDGVGSKLRGTHDGILNGSVYTADGLTRIIDGSTGYISSDTITSVHNFSTALQLGTQNSDGSGLFYNDSTPFVSMYATTTNTDPKITFNTANGTLTSPTAITANSKLGSVSFGGLVSGANYDSAVTVSGYADANITNNKVPGRFVVTTRSANGLGTNMLTFDSSGNLTVETVTGSLIGNASTATIAKGIDVYADAADRDASISPGERTIGMLAMLQDDGTGNSATSQYTASGWVTINGRYFTNSAQLAGFLSDETGTGSVVFSNSPTLISPTLGSATATSINKVNITTPAASATLTLATGSTLATVGGNSLTITTTANTAVTLPVSGTLVNSAVTTLSSLSSVGTITTGTWGGSFSAVSAANLTNLTAANLTGTIPSAVLANSSIFLGTTSIALNRPTGSLTVSGLNTDGYAGALKTAAGSVVVSASTAPTSGQVLTASSGTVAAWATPDISTYTGVLSPVNGGTGIANSLPLSKPSLLLDFANSRTLDPRITFNRASTATYTDADGLIKTAASGQARFDHNPTTGESLGLLIEEQRTNLLTYSENFDNAAWIKSNITIIANATTAPDGTLTADKLVENTDTTVSHYTGQNCSLSLSTAYTGTYYVKGAERTRCIITTGGDSWLAAGVFIDLSNGTVISYSGTASSATVIITDAGNGWYKCSLTATTGASGAGARNFLVMPVLSGTTSSYTGDGTSGIYIWGAQLEAGAFATSYIPSNDTFTSRASAGSFIGSNGLIQSAATNVARYNYNPLNLAIPPKLLLEPAATNLLTYSENFDNNVWVTDHAIITANATIAPDGTTTADMVTDTSTTVEGNISQNINVTSNDGITRTFSCFVKAGTATNPTVWAGYFTGTNWYGSTAVLNSNGTVSFSTDSNGSYTITPYPNNWYRISLTLKNTYTGATQVTAGVLKVTNASGLGATSTGTTVNGGTLELLVDVGAEPLILTNGTLKTTSGNYTSGGSISLSGDMVIDVVGSLTLSGNITGVGATQSITKRGNGTLVLGGSTTQFSGGITVSGGTLQAGVDSTASYSPFGSGTVTVH